MLLTNISHAIFVISASLLAMYGLNMLMLTAFFVRRYRVKPVAHFPEKWPDVTVQLPVFNEIQVVRRLIHAVANLDYPIESLSIQVLDDSTDETTDVVKKLVASYKEKGLNIECYHRFDRVGNKAGALARGLLQAKGEFIAIFDADFVPPPNYLKKTIPYFVFRKVGMVQTRWGHLNALDNPLTRAQAIALDGHLVVEQVARSRNNLCFNFNGSSGIWRKACIVSSGGWQSDTIAEDLDLSYRAQMAGWEFRYVSDVISPAEIPGGIHAFKRQQFRWVKGSVQCLLKHAIRLVGFTEFSIWKRIQAIMHLGGYLMHPMMLCFLVFSIPCMLYTNVNNVLPQWLGIAGLGPPVLYAIAQVTAYRKGLTRFIWFPVLMLLGLGVAVNNTRAVFEAIFRYKPNEFLRTPKNSGLSVSIYDLYANKNDKIVWLEFFFAVYAGASFLLSTQRIPALAPFLALFALGFVLVGLTGLLETNRASRFVETWKSEPAILDQDM
ncbi:MAG: glycosyl transferase [Anaerolineaceae bacterium]|nr:glycosyl transferase [Anaerolineaceae bacterium]|tara:strand:- start:9498 stop:10979 length:1482 start_codon:yes stop_codon:yes gene_type:complete